MFDVEELERERHYKLRSAKDLVDKAEKADRVLTDDEHRDIADLKTQAAELAKKIEQIRAHEAAAKELNAAMEAPAAKRQAPAMQPTNGEVPGSTGPRIEFIRYGSLKAFSGQGAEEKAYRAGMWARAAFHNDARAARWCRENGIEVRAMSETVNSAGGYLVPNEMMQTIIDLREQYGVFRRNAKVYPMGRDTMTIPRRTGGLTAYFAGEGTAITESDKSFDAVSLTAKKLGCLTRFSTELAEDAIINLADDLAQECAYAFALKEDQCGFIGDGTSTYGGILGIATKFEQNTNFAGYVDCATTGHDTFAEVDVTDLTTLMAKLPAYARMNAKWYCSQTAADLVFGRLSATAGGNTIQTMGGAFTPSFLGYPIEVSQVLQSGTSTQNNEHLLLFGDLSMAATLGDRREIRIATADQRYFAEDQIALKATERVDINVHDIGDATNAGPVVALIGFTS